VTDLPNVSAATTQLYRHDISITSVRLLGDEAVLLIEGEFIGQPIAVLNLVGARQVLPSTLSIAGTQFSARLALRVANFNGPLLAPRSGKYTLEARLMDASLATISLNAALPAQQLLTGLTRIAFTPAHVFTATFSAPLTDRERGALQQSALESDYRAATFEPLNAVFFESFFGRNASCNPLAIDRALAKLRPDIVRYWSVADGSVETPPGAIAVIEGSAEWWHARGSVRLLVVNDWLRKRLRKRSYQRVLQTWHGTMLKKLALSRRHQGVRAAIATLLERSRWDILLAQNPHSAKVFRTAYAFRGPIWQEGYPRDDILVGDDSAATQAAVRARLGIDSKKKIILYAPTWRDDHPDHVDHLDVARFATELGDDYAVLIRGHSRTLLPGDNVHGANVLDVTGYPDVSQLFLVADSLVTDYSSVMFDFSVTGKPIYFFTPDILHYRTNLRGFYFDLMAVAPGPVVSTIEQLLHKIQNPAVSHSEFIEKYLAWQLRFNPRDDGHSATRIVKRLLAEGILD
jgi:CDP-glycerol glycerophosphotransferase